MSTSSLGNGLSFSMRDLRLCIRDNTIHSDPTLSSEGHTTPLHRHGTYEIHFLLHGRETVSSVKGSSSVLTVQTIGEGQLLLIPPHILHTTQPGDGMESCVIGFDLQPLEPDGSGFSVYHSLTSLLNRVDRPVLLSDESFSLLRLEAVSRLRDRNGNYLLSRHSLFYQTLMGRILLTVIDLLLLEENEAALTRLPDRNEDRAFLITEFIYSNYALSDALGRLASLLHLGIRQTQTVVERLFGKSFHTLLTEQRMSIARTLVQTTSIPLSSVAESVGYTSYNSFFVAFRKFFGFSPNELREKETVPPLS